MLGELLGARYRVIDVLGSGGFGHTYIAEDTQRPGKPRCVLKHLTFASANTVVLEQVRRLFLAEAETLEKLGRHDQIPQLLAYFEEDKEFYLVQEFIQGRPLSAELIEVGHFSERQVISLLEDVLGILEYVHSQGVIHRDIKPENLIRRHGDGKFVLIDFGAVKTIGNTVAEATGETSLSIPIYTSGYGSSEQCLGRPRFSSDLYSLGMVAIQALTGMRPAQIPQDFNTSEVIWRDQVQVSDDLGAFLDKMVRYHFMHRYQSAPEALQALRQIISQSPTVMTHPATPLSRVGATILSPTETRPQASEVPGGKRRRSLTRPAKFWLIGGSVLVVVGAIALLRSITHPTGSIFPNLPEPNPTAITTPADLPFAVLQERISSGERLLNKWRTPAKKQEGIEKLATGDYLNALVALKTAWESDRDPETLIYINNARIGSARSYEIAAAIPLSDASLNSALEILRGVAQAQDAVNQAGGISGVPIKVKIVNDGNDRSIARQLAQTLIADPNVLGVVGHGISDTTIAAAEVYQAGQLVMIAPVSSAVQLSGMGSYVFRTMPSDRLTAKALVSYLLQQLKKPKVVIFFNSNSDYSKSLKNEFKDALYYTAGVDLLDQVDLARPDFEAYTSVNEAVAKGANVIMLASDHTTSDKAIQVVSVNSGRLRVLSGDSLYTPKLLNVAQKNAVGLVMAVPVDLTRSAFQQKYTQVWGKSNPVTWRTALAYDATQALMMALRSDPSRSGVQRMLIQPEFSVAGATEPIQFDPATGDRKGKVRLVTVMPITTGQTILYQFTPLPF